MIEIQGKYCKNLKIFTDNIEDAALATLYRIADSRAYDGAKIRVMADVHQGVGDSVIGFSCPINIENGYVNPQTVGCDLGCTVSLCLYDKPILPDKIAEFEHKIRKDVPFGFEINDKSKITAKDIIKRFNAELRKLYSKCPILSDYAIEFKQEKDLEDWCKRLKMDYGVFMKSLGSVGGGNHYVEYDVNEDDGQYGVCVHCGSRNLGQKVFRYWDNIAKSMCVSKEEMRMLSEKVKAVNTDQRRLREELKEAKENYLKDRIPGFLSGEHLYRYLIDANIAQTYARLNHMVIHKQIEEAYRKTSDGGKPIDDVIYTTHNYIDMDDLILRKGAIRAYKGELCIIPFNMRDGIAICEGKSNDDFNCTAPHGAGRLLSRSKAKEKLNVDEFKSQMADAGIYTTTADRSTLDEAPDAYKPMSEIVGLIEPTVNIIRFMRPKMNIKASES